MERLSRLLTVAALVTLVGVFPAPARAADVSFGTPKASSVFGESVTFQQPVTASGVDRAEILVTFPASIGPLVTPVAAPADGTSTLRHAILLSEGHLMPNTRLTARWRLTLDDGTMQLGPDVSITYADDRFEWRSAEGDLMRVHWYEGSAAFGRRALKIGEDAIAKAEDLLGVKETEPVDFFVYADQAAFYDALGPGTRENVGGQADSDIRTLFALITPGEIDDAWVGIVIPHELTHLVFDTAVRNPYHFPPRWLNEGVATYLSQGYDASDRQLVTQAADDGTLIPLSGLTGQFPTARDAFYLAYAESVAAVDYLVRLHGQDALVELIRSYSLGRTDDEAFGDALGVDTAAFETAWFASVGATVPAKVGPRPDPTGPLPPDWTSSGPTPTPTGSGQPSPSATPVPSGPAGGEDDGAPLLPIALAALAAVAVALGVVLFAMRRRPIARAAVPASASPPPGPWSAPLPQMAPLEAATTEQVAHPAVDTPAEGEASHGPDA